MTRQSTRGRITFIYLGLPAPFTPAAYTALSAEDIEHYQRVVVALNETIRIMGEIDAAIEAHGGWPIQ